MEGFNAPVEKKRPADGTEKEKILDRVERLNMAQENVKRAFEEELPYATERAAKNLSYDDPRGRNQINF